MSERLSFESICTLSSHVDIYDEIIIFKNKYVLAEIYLKNHK